MSKNFFDNVSYKTDIFLADLLIESIVKKQEMYETVKSSIKKSDDRQLAAEYLKQIRVCMRELNRIKEFRLCRFDRINKRYYIAKYKKDYNREAV